MVKDLRSIVGSYRHYALGEVNPIIDTSPIYQTMGRAPKERQRVYREVMRSRIAESNKTVD